MAPNWTSVLRFLRLTLKHSTKRKNKRKRTRKFADEFYFVIFNRFGMLFVVVVVVVAVDGRQSLFTQFHCYLSILFISLFFRFCFRFVLVAMNPWLLVNVQRNTAHNKHTANEQRKIAINNSNVSHQIKFNKNQFRFCSCSMVCRRRSLSVSHTSCLLCHAIIFMISILLRSPKLHLIVSFMILLQFSLRLIIREKTRTIHVCVCVYRVHCKTEREQFEKKAANKKIERKKNQMKYSYLNHLKLSSSFNLRWIFPNSEFIYFFLVEQNDREF